jgi:hypothetical protein
MVVALESRPRSVAFFNEARTLFGSVFRLLLSTLVLIRSVGMALVWMDANDALENNITINAAATATARTQLGFFIKLPFKIQFVEFF